MSDLASLPRAVRDELMERYIWDKDLESRREHDPHDSVDFPVSDAWAGYYQGRGLMQGRK